MSTLKFDIKPKEYVMNKVNKEEIYMFLHEEMHEIIVWREGEPPKTIPKNLINLGFIKVDPEVAKILYFENSPLDTPKES